jgi:hypothetical protein
MQDCGRRPVQACLFVVEAKQTCLVAALLIYVNVVCVDSRVHSRGQRWRSTNLIDFPTGPRCELTCTALRNYIRPMHYELNDQDYLYGDSRTK